jgi:hypothetical protein
MLVARLAGEVRQIAHDCGLRFARINAFQNSANTLFVSDWNNRMTTRKR